MCLEYLYEGGIFLGLVGEDGELDENELYLLRVNGEYGWVV